MGSDVEGSICGSAGGAPFAGLLGSSAASHSCASTHLQRQTLSSIPFKSAPQTSNIVPEFSSALAMMTGGSGACSRTALQRAAGLPPTASGTSTMRARICWSRACASWSLLTLRRRSRPTGRPMCTPKSTVRNKCMPARWGLPCAHFLYVPLCLLRAASTVPFAAELHTRRCCAHVCMHATYWCVGVVAIRVHTVPWLTRLVERVMERASQLWQFSGLHGGAWPLGRSSKLPNARGCLCLVCRLRRNR